MTCGQFLKDKILVPRKMSVVELAQKLDIEADILQDVVDGETKMPTEWAFRLSRHYALPIKVLLDILDKE